MTDLKHIDIAAYGVYKITPEVLKNLPLAEEQPNQDSLFTKEIKKTNSKAVVLINPDRHEMLITTIVLHNDSTFISQFPDPVHIFFNQAYTSFQCAELCKQEFEKNTFRQHGKIKMIHPNVYNTYIAYRSSTIIFLLTAMEAFINSIIPDDYIHERITDSGVQKMDKSQIERYMSIFDKINDILPVVTKIHFKKDQQLIYSHLKALKSQRDILIHLKTAKNEKNMEVFTGQFGDILNHNHSQLIHSVKDFMNLITPNYIKM